jgi:hypothetical protein
MTPAQKEQLEALARQWEDPKTGQPEPDLTKALRGMVCDYFGYESCDEKIFTGSFSDKITYWAERVCLYPLDIYDEALEEDLIRHLTGEDRKLITQAKEFIIEPTPALEHSMEKGFRYHFEEECPYCPFIGLLDDYLSATPLEKALINFVLRRLANTTLPALYPRLD